jgi:hypothetical protein
MHLDGPNIAQELLDLGKSSNAWSRERGEDIDKTTGNPYIMLEFEWDDEKATTNWRNHGVTFHQGIQGSFCH